MLCAQTAEAASCPLNAPLLRESPAYAGQVDVSAAGVDIGVTAGLLFTPLRWLRVGAGVHTNAGRVSMPTEIDVQIPAAVVDFVRTTMPTITPSAIEVSATINFGMPFVAMAGFAVLPSEKLELAFDLHWMNTAATSTTYTVIRRSTSALIDDMLTVRGRQNQYLLCGARPTGFWTSCARVLHIALGTNTRPIEFVTPTSIDMTWVGLHAGLIWRVNAWMDVIAEMPTFHGQARGHAQRLWAERLSHHGNRAGARPAGSVRHVLGEDGPRGLGAWRFGSRGHQPSDRCAARLRPAGATS